MIVHLNEKEFEEKAKENKNKNETCLVDFYADWCPPCKMLAPVLEAVSEKYKDKINFYKINIDENNSIALKYEIMYVPTLIIFKNGEILEKTSGFMNEQQLSDFIDKSI